MKKTQVPSKKPITEGQIGDLTEIFIYILRLHKKKLPTNLVEEIITSRASAVGTALLETIQRQVEAVSQVLIKRTVKINRERSPEEALNATGKMQYITEKIVATMPRGDKDEEEIFFFNVGRHLTDEKLEEEYNLRGLKPASPYALAAADEADPTFSDTHPNGTHWKDANGKWCYAVFRKSARIRSVYVHVRVRGWDGVFWFAGVRK